MAKITSSTPSSTPRCPPLRRLIPISGRGKRCAAEVRASAFQEGQVGSAWKHTLYRGPIFVGRTALSRRRFLVISPTRACRWKYPGRPLVKSAQVVQAYTAERSVVERRQLARAKSIAGFSEKCPKLSRILFRLRDSLYASANLTATLIPTLMQQMEPPKGAAPTTVVVEL